MQFIEVSPVRNNQPLFENISFTVNPGEVVAVMGSSGVGKSSLISCITENLLHTGEILMHGKNFQVFQETDQLFPWMTTIKNLELAGPGNWYYHAEQWGIAHLLNKSPDTLSVGQRQRFTLLRALYSNRSNLLCDEPLSGVDWGTAKNILKLFCNSVAETDKRVLWVTHNPKEVQFFNRVINIK